MIKKTAIAFATSILLGAGASLTALPAVAADAPVKAEQVKSLPNIAILATGGTIARPGSRLSSSAQPGSRSRAAVPARFRLRIMVLVPATNQSVLKF